MMDRTDRHFRALLRRVTQHTLLYTEMITTAAIVHGDRDHLLRFSPVERPLALQLGGDDPEALAACARIAVERGYDEINLNVGCPSDRVQEGRFGACLMAAPERVARAVAAMRSAVELPVTVKHRIGIDDRDSYEDMLAFVDIVAEAGADRFTVHARKAVLGGLSPRQNRQIPPLRHDDVHRLKRDRPHLKIELNGGVLTLAAARAHLAGVDAVMIGRAAYDDPMLLAGADALLAGATGPPKTAHDVVRDMLPYLERHLTEGGRMHDVTRHMMGLFTGRPGARAWRRLLSTEAARPGVGPAMLERALARIPRAA